MVAGEPVLEEGLALLCERGPLPFRQSRERVDPKLRLGDGAVAVELVVPAEPAQREEGALPLGRGVGAGRRRVLPEAVLLELLAAPAQTRIVAADVAHPVASLLAVIPFGAVSVRPSNPA